MVFILIMTEKIKVIIGHVKLCVCVWPGCECGVFMRRAEKQAPLAAPVNLLGPERVGPSAAGISCLLILGGTAHFCWGGSDFAMSCGLMPTVYYSISFCGAWCVCVWMSFIQWKCAVHLPTTYYTHWQMFWMFTAISFINQLSPQYSCKTTTV